MAATETDGAEDGDFFAIAGNRAHHGEGDQDDGNDEDGSNGDDDGGGEGLREIGDDQAVVVVGGE